MSVNNLALANDKHFKVIETVRDYESNFNLRKGLWKQEYII